MLTPDRTPAPAGAGGLPPPGVMLAGELEDLSQLPAASNATYLARLRPASGGEPHLVVYKPRMGEEPLWDFPGGTLCQREVAAYLLSEAGGWGFVPATVLGAGPLGMGSIQAFVDHDPARNAFDLAETHPVQMRSIAAFDLLVNNADRKAGHVLLDLEGGIWAVDHGVCFHPLPKLRTVLWDFIGEPIPPPDLESVRQVLEGLDGWLGDQLAALLDAGEISALAARAERLLAEAVFPPPGPGRPYPWPPV